MQKLMTVAFDHLFYKYSGRCKYLLPDTKGGLWKIFLFQASFLSILLKKKVFSESLENCFFTGIQVMEQYCLNTYQGICCINIKY